MTTTVQAILADDEVAEIDRLAREDGRSRSQMTRRLVIEALAARASAQLRPPSAAEREALERTLPGPNMPAARGRINPLTGRPYGPVPK